MSSADDVAAIHNPERTLQRHKAIALAVLCAMAAVWFATFHVPYHGSVIGYVRAAAEAGLIGGLADWFAVVALFKKPLGLPIPHTNLIQSNQSDIANGVANYIDQEFLGREGLIRHFRELDVTGKLDGILNDAVSRDRLIDEAIPVIRRLLGKGDDGLIVRAIAQAAQAGISRTDIRPLLLEVTGTLSKSDDLPPLVQAAATKGRELLASKKDAIVAEVANGTGRWVPSFVDAQLANRLISFIDKRLEEAQSPETELGRQIQTLVKDLPQKLEQSPEILDRLADRIRSVADDQRLQAIARAAWTDIKELLERDLLQPDSMTRVALAAVVDRLAENLDSLSFRRKIEATLESFFVEAIPGIRTKIRQSIVKTLSEQNAKEFAWKIELQVGKDLQFIRLNGTLIGALIGVLLHAIVNVMKP